MIVLGPSDFLTAAATSASVVAYTVGGTVYASQSTVQGVLAQGLLPATPPASGLVTLPTGAVGGQINNIFVTNTGATTQVVKLWVNGVDAQHSVGSVKLQPGGYATLDARGLWQVYTQDGLLVTASLALTTYS